MEDFEVDQLFQSHYQMIGEKLTAIAPEEKKNSIRSNMVKLCINCSYKFRAEIKPHSEFCSKDCETCYWWFRKRPESSLSSISTFPLNNNPTVLPNDDSSFEVSLELQSKTSDCDLDSRNNSSVSSPPSIKSPECNAVSSTKTVNSEKNISHFFRIRSLKAMMWH